MALQFQPALSNTERQRLFRQRNPGYYARIQATNRAAEKRQRDKSIRELRAAHAERCAAELAAGATTGTANAAIAPDADTLQHEAPTAC